MTGEGQALFVGITWFGHGSLEQLEAPQGAVRIRGISDLIRPPKGYPGAPVVGGVREHAFESVDGESLLARLDTNSMQQHV